MLVVVLMESIFHQYEPIIAARIKSVNQGNRVAPVMGSRRPQLTEEAQA